MTSNDQLSQQIKSTIDAETGKWIKTCIVLFGGGLIALGTMYAEVQASKDHEKEAKPILKTVPVIENDIKYIQRQLDEMKKDNETDRKEQKEFNKELIKRLDHLAQ